MNDLELLKAAFDLMKEAHASLLEAQWNHPLRVQMAQWCEKYEGSVTANGQAISELTSRLDKPSMADLYPAYHKVIPEGWTTIDTYRVNQLFPVADDSGMLLHARKKLLVPGCRTGGNSAYDDVKEAVDTLKAWLEENKPVEVKPVSPAWARGKLLQTQIGVGPEKWYYEIEGSNVFSGYFGESDKAIDHAYKHRVKLTNL